MQDTKSDHRNALLETKQQTPHMHPYSLNQAVHTGHTGWLARSLDAHQTGTQSKYVSNEGKTSYGMTEKND